MRLEFFAGTCPDCFVLWLAHMIQSGELYIFFLAFSFTTSKTPRAKYPLSIVSKAMGTLGPHLLVGYNICCVSGGTILSTFLDDKFHGSGSRTFVKAYHGYFNNSTHGMGLEILECIFSSSNCMAVVTQLGSAFQQWLFIEMHVK